MEITAWIVLLVLECDREEECTFEFRKHSSSCPMELSSAQRKKLTFGSLIHTLETVLSPTLQALNSQWTWLPRPLGKYRRFVCFFIPVHPFLSPCPAVYRESRFKNQAFQLSNLKWENILALNHRPKDLHFSSVGGAWKKQAQNWNGEESSNTHAHTDTERSSWSSVLLPRLSNGAL